METGEMFDILDSFIAGFGNRDNADTHNAIFIAVKLFDLDLPLEWKGVGRLGVESLKLYRILEGVMPNQKNLEAFKMGRKLSDYSFSELMVMASYLWNEGRSSLTEEERRKAPALLEELKGKKEELEPQREDIVPMKKRSEEHLLILLCTEDTRRILRLLNEHDRIQYTKMRECMDICALDTRLRGLLHFGLTSYQCEMTDKKVEWYTITEKGREFLEHVEAIVPLISYSSSG